MSRTQEKRSAVSRVPIDPGGDRERGYDVLVGAGLVDRCGALITERCPAHRYALITDDRVEELYAPRVQQALAALDLRLDVFSFPAGEERKRRETWASLGDAMLDEGIGRDGAVISLGGGVVGDLGGFVAATYMRGIPVVQVPTTVVAMIDASIGGKTGVDTRAGKNLIGAFHQPRLVLADPEVLGTLPLEHLRAGFAEALKHAAIADRTYFDWMLGAAPRLLSRDAEALAELIVRSVEIKAAVVRHDTLEAGPRKALNFGHTIGHALEAASGYRILHGEAVAMGMVAEARIGETLGMTNSGTAERLRAALERFGLTASIPPEIHAKDLVVRTRADKKARRDRVEYALIEGIGAVGEQREWNWGHSVPDEVVLHCLDAMRDEGRQNTTRHDSSSV